MELILEPWPWYVSGPLIALIMFLLIFIGKRFGMSSNLSTICTMCGADKKAEFFDINWKESAWNLVVVVGAVIGGFVGAYVLSDDPVVSLNPTTVQDLQNLGFSSAGKEYMPTKLFSNEVFLDVKSLVILMLGGIFIGFGARYAGGCTSGHAISGLSNLQLPSLIAVIGFFIGGLFMVHVLFPFIF